MHSNFLGADFQDALTVHLVTATSPFGNLALTVWTTVDAGATWSTSKLPALKNEPPALLGPSSPDAWQATVAFPDAAHGYLFLIMNIGGLVDLSQIPERAFAFRTIDGGRNWSRLPRGAWGSYFGFSGPERGWSGHEGALYTTEDGGETWSRVAFPGLADLNTNVFWPGPMIWSATQIVVRVFDVADSRQLLFEMTTDGGRNWHLDKRVLPPGIGGDVSLIDKDTWIAPYRVNGTQGERAKGMMLSRDRGLTWTEIRSQLGIPLSEGLHFTDVLHGWTLAWVGHAELYGTTDGGVNWMRLDP